MKGVHDVGMAMVVGVGRWEVEVVTRQSWRGIRCMRSSEGGGRVRDGDEERSGSGSSDASLVDDRRKGTPCVNTHRGMDNAAVVYLMHVAVK